MATTSSIQEVYQWQNHPVTDLVRVKAKEQRDSIIERLLSGQITEENIGDRNFKLGQLQVLNYIIGDDLFNDLCAEVEERDGK